MKLRGPQGSLNPGIGPPKHGIFILFLFLFLNVNLGPLPKNRGPNPMSFQFLTGGRLTWLTFAPLTLELWRRLCCPRFGHLPEMLYI